MKVAAAVGVVCLIVVVVNGFSFRVPALKTMDGDKVRVKCFIEWENHPEDNVYHQWEIGLGETRHLSTDHDSDCYECGPCEYDGLNCTQLFSACPEDYVTTNLP